MHKTGEAKTDGDPNPDCRSCTAKRRSERARHRKDCESPPRCEDQQRRGGLGPKLTEDSCESRQAHDRETRKDRAEESFPGCRRPAIARARSCHCRKRGQYGQSEPHHDQRARACEGRKQARARAEEQGRAGCSKEANGCGGRREHDDRQPTLVVRCGSLARRSGL